MSYDSGTIKPSEFWDLREHTVSPRPSKMSHTNHDPLSSPTPPRTNPAAHHVTHLIRLPGPSADIRPPVPDELWLRTICLGGVNQADADKGVKAETE